MATKDAKSDPLYDHLMREDCNFSTYATYEYFEISVLRVIITVSLRPITVLMLSRTL